MALTDWFTRRRHRREESASGPVHATMVLSRFLATVGRRPEPTVLDLGPAVGSNVTFFGQEVGCKVLVDDVLKDVEQHSAGGTLDALPAFFDTRLPYASDSIDGILCWDVFDYLDRPAAERLARQLMRVLRPGGVLLALFGTVAPSSSARPCYTRHIVVDLLHLEYRPYAGTRARQRPFLNRDVQKLFEPLRMAENYLLGISVREVLLRKPADSPPAASPALAG